MTIDTSKRDFFRRAGKKVSEVVIDQTEKKMQIQAVNWFRPPFAVSELEFLLACMRCSACVTACEPGVIFSLTENQGLKVAGTPAMDLTHKACQLCVDWPCVTACTSGALTLEVISNNQSDEEDIEKIQVVPSLPKLARITIDNITCLPFFGPECGFCVSVCPVDDAISLVNEKPVVNNDVCVGCAQCRDACVTDPSSINVLLLTAK